MPVKQARLIQTMCDVATVDLSDNITTVFDGPCVVYGVYVNTVLSAQACPIQDGTQAIRTNLILSSEDWDTTWADANNGITTANQTTSPNGDTTADLLVDDGSTGAGFAGSTQTIVLDTNTSYTYSVFAKKKDHDFIYLNFNAFTGITNTAVYFDLTNGVASDAGSDVDASGIIDDGDGWFRCWVSVTTVADGAGTMRVFVAQSGGTLQLTALDGTNSIFLWGADLKTGGLSDYIPTTDTIRSADMPVIVLPAATAAGTNLDFPGIRFDEALVVNPDDAATGEITITYRRINPN